MSLLFLFLRAWLHNKPVVNKDGLKANSRLGSSNMDFARSISKIGNFLASLVALTIFLTGCVTRPAAPVSQFETLAGAVTVPYRISSSGRFLVDVSINGGPARPMSVDTGATVSVVYDDVARALDLTVSEKTRFVRGLVGQGDRPVIEDVTFQIGSQSFPLGHVVTLETPAINDDAIGLLGGDILRQHIVLFNRDAMRATFIPRGRFDPDSFAGWRPIPLRTVTDVDMDSDLYFTTTHFGETSVSVLIDTGSNLNFVNWKLATMDRDIRRLERQMIRDGTLQGALETTSASVETVFFDLKLGGQLWDEIPVVVTGLDGLADLAPVDEPMMVAGANLFTPHTVAFDLAGRTLFVYPETKP